MQDVSCMFAMERYTCMKGSPGKFRLGRGIDAAQNYTEGSSNYIEGSSNYIEGIDGGQMRGGKVWGRLSKRSGGCGQRSFWMA